jgi:hypothetical protein
VRHRKRSGYEGMVLFAYLFPEQAERETRVAHVFNEPGIPRDSYAMVESYCIDPSCDCRRVILNVFAESRKAILATINYGFDPRGEMPGPFLDLLNTQSPYSDALLEMVKRVVLSDARYVVRLHAHYRQVKAAVADPRHPVHDTLREMLGGRGDAAAAHRPDKNARERDPRPPSLNAPCPCGSGRKYKRCCGSEL